MINGVEILTSNEVVSGYAFNWMVFWIIGIIILVLLIISGIFLWIRGESDLIIIPALSVIGLFLGPSLGFVFGYIIGEPTDYITEYKVTISDEVLMTEFYEHYEVIEQEGKIFTIRERNNDKEN